MYLAEISGQIVRRLLLHLTLLATLLLACTGCASFANRSWPAEIPARDDFVAYYLKDQRNSSVQTRDQYLGWIVSFYRGTVAYPQGWLDIESRLLAPIPQAEREVLEAKLEALGIAIGSEWAKSNDVRMIDTRMLSLWGSIMQLAQADRKELAAIELIGADVERLGAGTLRKQDVVESRYTGPLGLESFGDF